MGKEDYYKILSVEPNASQNEINETVKRLLAVWGSITPENDPNFDKHSKFVSDIRRASTVLQDPARRLEYDIRQGHRKSRILNQRVHTSSSAKLKEAGSIGTLSTVGLPSRLSHDRLEKYLALMKPSQKKTTGVGNDSVANKGQYKHADPLITQPTISSESEMSASDDDNVYEKRSSTLAKLAEWFNKLHFNIKSANTEKTENDVTAKPGEEARNQTGKELKDPKHPSEKYSDALNLTESSKVKCSFSHNDIALIQAEERARLSKEYSLVAKGASKTALNLLKEISGKTNDSRNTIQKVMKDSFDEPSHLKKSPRDTGRVWNLMKGSGSNVDGSWKDEFHPNEVQEKEMTKPEIDAGKFTNDENHSNDNGYMISSCSDSDGSDNSDLSPDSMSVQRKANAGAGRQASVQKPLASTSDKLYKKQKSEETTDMSDTAKPDDLSAPGKYWNENRDNNNLLNTYKLDEEDRSAKANRHEAEGDDQSVIKAVKNLEKIDHSPESGFKSEYSVILKNEGEHFESTSVENEKLSHCKVPNSFLKDNERTENNFVSSVDVSSGVPDKNDVKPMKDAKDFRKKPQKDLFTSTALQPRTVSFSLERAKPAPFSSIGIQTHSQDFQQTRLKPVLKNSGSSREARELMKHMFQIPVFKPIPIDSLELLADKRKNRLKATSEELIAADSRKIRKNSFVRMDDTDGESEISNADLAKKIADRFFGVLEAKNAVKSSGESDELIKKPYRRVSTRKARYTEEPGSLRLEAIESNASDEESQKPSSEKASSKDQNKKFGEKDTDPACGRFPTGKTSFPEKIDVISQKTGCLKGKGFQNLLKFPKVDSNRDRSLEILDEMEYMPDTERLASLHQSRSLPPKISESLIYKDTPKTVSDNSLKSSESSTQQISATSSDEDEGKQDVFINKMKRRRKDFVTRGDISRQILNGEFELPHAKMKNVEAVDFRKVPVNSFNLLRSKNKYFVSLEEPDARSTSKSKELEWEKNTFTSRFPQTMDKVSKESLCTDSSEEGFEKTSELLPKDTNVGFLKKEPVDSILLLKTRKEGKLTAKVSVCDSEETDMDNLKDADSFQPLTEPNALKMLEKMKSMIDDFCQRFSKPDDYRCKSGIVESDKIHDGPHDVSMMESDTNDKNGRKEYHKDSELSVQIDKDRIFSRSPNIESITVDARKHGDVPKLGREQRESPRSEQDDKLVASTILERQSHARTAQMISDTLPSACSIPGVKTVAATTLLRNASITTVYHFGATGTELIEVFVDEELRAKIVKAESHDAYYNVMKQGDLPLGSNIRASTVIAANGCEMRTDVFRRDMREIISVYRNGELLCKTGNSVVE